MIDEVMMKTFRSREMAINLQMIIFCLSLSLTAAAASAYQVSCGIIIQSCTITATVELESSVFPVRAYLGRPWSNYSTTIIMQSFIDAFIDPVGWMDWDNRSALDTIEYLEFANRGPGADTSRRVNWKGFEVPNNSLDVAQFTVRQIIDGASWIPSTGFPAL